MSVILSLTACAGTSSETPEGDNKENETQTEESAEAADSGDAKTADSEDAESTGSSTDSSQGLKLPGNDNEENTNNTDTETSSTEADHFYTYTETVKPYEGSEDISAEEESYSFDIVYNLYAMDDKTAKMEILYKYNPQKIFTETYEGTWTKYDDSVEFEYSSADVYDGDSNYIFAIERGKVTSVSNYAYNSMIAKAVGTYTCDDPEIGKMTLDIAKDASAVLTLDNGTVFNGHISCDDTRYNFFCYDENDELVYDWYIDCSVNGTFSHTPYGNGYSVHYDGLYRCTGMLGDFDMTVYEDGSADVTIKIDGTDRYFSGSTYPKYTDLGPDPNNIGEVYLTSEDGYSLNLQLEYMWDISKWNYYGTLTSPLAAG